MTVSPQSIDLAKQFEGLVLTPYRCPAGYLTIGYGHNLEADGLRPEKARLLLGDGITEERAQKILVEDLKIAQADARRFFPDITLLSDNRRAVLVDMSFNMGLPTLSRFKRFRAALEARDYEQAAKQMEGSRWYGQVGFRSKKLVQLMRDG